MYSLTCIILLFGFIAVGNGQYIGRTRRPTLPERCASMICPMANCINPVRPEGECCPVCPGNIFTIHFLSLSFTVVMFKSCLLTYYIYNFPIKYRVHFILQNVHFIFHTFSFNLLDRTFYGITCPRHKVSHQQITSKWYY
jgi:hypothetical protein